MGFNVGLSGPAAWCRTYEDMGHLMSFYVETDAPTGVIDPQTGEPMSGNTKFTIPDWVEVYPAGTYDLSWDGGGTVGGSASPTTVSLSDSGNITLNCTGAIRNLSFKRQGTPDFYTQTFMARARHGECIRFMESQRINEDGGASAAEYDPLFPYIRKRVVAAGNTFYHRIMTHAEQARICRDHDKDLWICLHHRSTDQNILDAISQIVATGFNRTLYVEFSNEVWNSSFPQYHVLLQEAIDSGEYTGAPGDAAMVQGYYADRCHRIGELVKGAYANARMVIASQTAGPNFYNNWNDYSIEDLSEIDEVAISWYFGGPPSRAMSQGEALALDGAGLATLCEDDWNDRVIGFINTWKGYAQSSGWGLIGYEGGSHTDNADSTAEEHLAGLCASTEMGTVHATVMDWWATNIDSLICAFQDVGSPTDPWSWTTETGSNTPRWQEYIDRARQSPLPTTPGDPGNSSSRGMWLWAYPPATTELVDESRTGSGRPVQPGYALSLDGVDDQVTLSSIPNTSGAVTVCAWVRYPVTNQYESIAWRNPVDTKWGLFGSTGGVFTWRGSSVGAGDLNFGTRLANTWQHVAVTHSGTNAKGYVDGQFEDETSSAELIGDSGGSMTVGNFDGGSGDWFFAGDIGQVLAFDRELTAAEVQSVYNGKRVAGVIVALEFEESSGPTAYDSSGNGNHGTLVGGPTWVESSEIPSRANEVGYSDNGGVIVPRDESDPDNDAMGNPLQYKGKCPRDALLLQSNALSFNGVDQRIDLPSTVSETNATFCCWFRKGDASANKIVYSQAAGNHYVQEVYPTGQIILATSGASPTFNTQYGSFAVGQWYHLAVVKEGSNYRVYLDGVESSDGQQAGGPDMQIDWIAGYASAQFHFNGELVDFRIFDRALSAADVSDVVAQVNLDSPLVQYPLAEGGGTTAHDVSGNENDGSLIGIPTVVQQDVYHYNVRYGATDMGTYYEPALITSSRDKLGPAETQIDFQAGEPNDPANNGLTIPADYQHGDTLSTDMEKTVDGSDEHEFKIKEL